MDAPSYSAQVTTWEESGWPSMIAINLETMSLEEIAAALDRLGPADDAEGMA